MAFGVFEAGCSESGLNILCNSGLTVQSDHTRHSHEAMLAWTYILTHDERRPVAGLTKGAASCVAQGSPARGASQRSRRLQVTQEGIEPAEDTLVEGAGAPWRLRRRRRRRPTMLLVLSISIGSKPRYCLYRVEGRSRRRARRVCNLSCTPRGARETSRANRASFCVRG